MGKRSLKLFHHYWRGQSDSCSCYHMFLSKPEFVNLTDYRHAFQIRSLSFHLPDDIYELFFMDDQFRECLWCQTKWHGSTFEWISSMSSLRIQVVTSSELLDRRIHKIKWSTGCRNRLSSFIVWDIQAFATSTMNKRGQSFVSGRECSSVFGNVIRYWFTTDVVIDEDNWIHWSYHDPSPFISDDSIRIWSMCFFFPLLNHHLYMSDISKRPSLKISDLLS